MASDLADLFNKYGSDKEKSHGYTSHYEKYFIPLRNESIKFFEIGVDHGASLKAWYDYFPKASIIGMDIKPCRQFENDRVKTYCGNATLRGHLKKFTSLFGSDFDIIIDDGSHICREILITLSYFFKSLKPGGTYIAEDLFVAPEALAIFDNMQETGKLDHQRIIEMCNSDLVDDECLDYIEENTAKCYFSIPTAMFVFEKKAIL